MLNRCVSGDHYPVIDLNENTFIPQNWLLEGIAGSISTTKVKEISFKGPLFLMMKFIPTTGDRSGSR